MGSLQLLLDSDLSSEILKALLTTIQAVLLDAEQKQSKNEAVKNWLRKLKDAAYEADDLLDEISFEAQRKRLPTTHVRCFFSHQNQFVFKLKMSHKLRSVREKLDGIASEKHKFHLREEVIVVGDREAGVLDWRQTTSLVNESEIIGREKEKEELMNKLLANSEQLSVYAICGMGGLGKTTLAQLVFNDERIKSDFDLSIWVCVSDDFDLKRLTRAVLESIEGRLPTFQELDPLQRQLREKLSGKKFLLVLDDVWNENRDKWDGLRNTIQSGSTGSVVIVTTRIGNIAQMMATGPIYSMERLSDSDSWSLFRQRAFGLEREEEFSHLETIGRHIVKKCGGVPLAIKAMGSLLHLKRKENEWLSVKDSEIWDLSNEGTAILSALRLSYNYLAVHVKQCFAFCSIFPKDYLMKKDELIGLWMENGFIPCETQMDLYDNGQEIFEELVWRSFLQEVKEKKFDGTITCDMHDLIHDVAQSITVDECKLVKFDKAFVVPKTVRHMSIYLNSLAAFYQGNNLFSGQSLRSFLWLAHHDSQQPMSFSLSGQKNLRVLDLSGSGLGKLPISISRLKHLRYLDFSNSNIKSLPEDITSLLNLQTLNLRHCHVLYKLPRGLKHLKNLIHLDIFSCCSLTYMPGEIGKLTCLRKLSDFIVGEDSGHHIGELKDLNLGGELSIKKIEYVKSRRAAKSANLMQKKELSLLSLFWSGGGEYNSNISEEVLDGLQPHSNLKNLSINRYPGSQFPNWMMDLLLPNLVKINLVGCDRCKHLPPFGKLKFLKILDLREMDGVKCIGNEVYGNGESSFPSLENLTLYYLDGLEEWEMPAESGRNIFPVLESLNIYRCPKLVELPIIPSPVLENLYIYHCPKLVEIPIIASVKTLKICGGSEMLLRSVEKFSFITKLVIEDYPELTLLPDGFLQSHTYLEELMISDLSNLKSLTNELDKLASLKSLQLYGCQGLESLPESLNYLEVLDAANCGIKSFPPNYELCAYASLRALSFHNCGEFACLSDRVRHLTRLETLLLNGLPKLNSLPDSIRHLTALRTLRIWYCEGLSSLPNQMESLTSLSILEIESCPKLMCLPDGICNLDMLRVLRIINCPVLKRRCQRETGEDWPKIAHIPVIRIKDQRREEYS